MHAPHDTAGGREAAGRRAAYRAFYPITSRWMDNDVYGHVNNVVYYSYFDTAVGLFLIERGLVDYAAGSLVFVVAETGCRFHRPIRFPDRVTAGLRIDRLGARSVRYRIGIFANDDEEAAAEGHFVHVQVNRATMRPAPIPPATRAALHAIADEEK